MRESLVQAACMDLFARLGWWHMRANAGRVGGCQLAPTGTADVIAREPGRARMWWVECKGDGGNPTSEQIAAADRHIRDGGVYVLAYDAMDVAKEIERRRGR